MRRDATSSQIDADYTPASAGSLRQLRAEMLSRAAIIGTRARSAQIRGDMVQARALHSKAERLVEIARSVRVK